MTQLLYETPQHSSLSAPSGPWSLDPQTAGQIRCKAARMVGTAGLTLQDRDDLEQELTAVLLARLSRFNAQRAKRQTFVARLLEHAAADIIAGREAEKRDWRRSVFSLDLAVEDGDGESLPLLDLLNEQRQMRDSVQASDARREQLALRIDMERVLATLPEQERRLCQALMTMNMRDAARHLRLPRSKLYKMSIRLREAFTAAGLKKYLYKNEDTF